MTNLSSKLIYIIPLIFLYFSGFPQNTTNLSEEEWVEYHLQRMSLEEKIGQLFMVPLWTRPTEDNLKIVAKWVKKYNLGGIIFMQGTPYKQMEYSNYLQRISKYPLLIAQDAEWGPAMRLDSVPRLPKQMTMGAIGDDSLLYQYGKYLAKLCRSLGVHINFAPVVDVNINPDNPVINYRSFGENKHMVTQKALMVMHGLQDNGVFATAKHFPGHGDTDKDSHYNLPVIKHDIDRLNNIELYPFKYLIKYGVKAIMTAHLYVPALDSTENLPTSLSEKIIKGLLRDSLKFNGLVFSDALTMHAVLKYFPPGKVELQALKAGNDILLFPSDLELAFKTIKQAVLDSVITEEEIETHVKRILKAKYQLGLNIYQNRFVNPINFYKIANSDSLKLFIRKCYKKAITLVNNEVLFLPVQNISNEKIAYLQIGYDKFAPFYQFLQAYTKIDGFLVQRKNSPYYLDSIAQSISDNYSTVIIGFFRIPHSPRRLYGMSAKILDMLCEFHNKGIKTVVCLFGNPYALQYLQKETATIVAYEENKTLQEAAAEIIFGGLDPYGKLPISFKGKYPYPAPYPAYAKRFGFAIPQEVGVNTNITYRLDSLMTDAIAKHYTPGAQLLLMKDGKIFYHKSFGFETYQNKQPITLTNHIYDVASLTKVVATTLAAMKLYEDGKLNLYKQIQYYLPETKRKPIGKIKIINLLLHKTGMPPYITYWKKLDDPLGNLDTNYIKRHPEENFTLQLTDKLFLRNDFPDTLFSWIINLQLSPTKKYKYSDFNMIILAKIVERITNKNLEKYLRETFYDKLGMFSTSFNPRLKCLPYRTPPTEIDVYFRKDTIRGYVHDENAALLGGIAGHAGIFTNVYDLAKLAFLMLESGEYGAECLLNAETVSFFTKRFATDNRRGLGWDKPETAKNKPSPTTKLASPYAFGHLGFTGTQIWIDPKYRIACILLTNRTYPSRSNDGFNKASVRTKVMEIFYESLR